jgi:hypothetical protein
VSQRVSQHGIHDAGVAGFKSCARYKEKSPDQRRPPESSLDGLCRVSGVMPAGRQQSHLHLGIRDPRISGQPGDVTHSPNGVRYMVGMSMRPPRLLEARQATAYGPPERATVDAPYDRWARQARGTLPVSTRS